MSFSRSARPASRVRLAAACLVLTLSVTGCGRPAADTAAADHLTMELPKGLREVSGLTAHNGELFVIGDEQGLVYRIRFAQARVKKWLRFGDPPEKEDFEGLAVYRGALYATTSRGVLYRSDNVADGKATAFQRFDTGLAELCEIEGLEAWPEREVLLLLCKTPLQKHLRGNLNLFAWSPELQQRVPEADIQVPFDAFDKPLKDGKVFPSAVSRVNTGQLWLLSAQGKRLLKISLDGKALAAGDLPDKKIHNQAEGFVFADGYFYVANEAGKKGKRGTLTRYRELI